MLTLVPKERGHSRLTGTDSAVRMPLRPVGTLLPLLQANESGERLALRTEAIVIRLKSLAAARIHAQCAFEHVVHASETLRVELRAALDQGKDDLARRLLLALNPVRLEQEALGRQLENLDQESKMLRSRLRRLRLLCPRSAESSRGSDYADCAEQWLDAELLKRKTAHGESPAPGDEP